MEPKEKKEPTEAIEQADPIEPIERIDPLEPIERNESSDHNDQRDVAPVIRVMGSFCRETLPGGPACAPRSGCLSASAVGMVVLHPSARLLHMAFGQQQGPPASAKQVQELLALLQEAGHSDFRDARGPMGFTQRQAGGKFTRTEVDVFLEQLRDAEPVADKSVEVPTWRRYPREEVLSGIATEHLAVELRRRGWTVVEP
jgi:hypothetical protein